MSDFLHKVGCDYQPHAHTCTCDHAPFRPKDSGDDGSQDNPQNESHYENRKIVHLLLRFEFMTGIAGACLFCF